MAVNEIRNFLRFFLLFKSTFYSCASAHGRRASTRSLKWELGKIDWNKRRHQMTFICLKDAVNHI